MTVDTRETRDPLAELDAQARASYEEGDRQAAKQVWEAILQMSPDHEGALAGLEQVSRDEAGAGIDQGGEENAAPEPAASDEPAVPGTPPPVDTPQPPPAGPEPEKAALPEAFDPVLLAGLSRAKEKIDAGDMDSAAALLEELSRDNPGHPDIEELRARCAGTPDGTSASPGEPEGLDLELDLPPAAPDDVSPAGPDTGAPPVTEAGGFDLDMDLPDANPNAGAGPAAPDGELTSARDLLDAVGELGVERPVEGLQLGPDADAQPAGDARGGAVSEEATALVQEARAALEEGDSRKALQIASRAMAIDENVRGAAEVLEDARAFESARGDEAERQLTEAISELEQGRPAEAIPRFERVLELVPGHVEAEAYLSQARQAATGQTTPSGPVEFDGGELEGVDSVPLGRRETDQDTAGTGPLTGDASADTGPTGMASAPVEPPPPVEIAAASSTPESPQVALPPPPPVPGPESPPGPEAAPSPPPAPTPPIRPARTKGGGGNKTRVLLLVVLAVVALGAGAWYGLMGLGLFDASEDAEVIRAPRTQPRPTPALAETVDPATGSTSEGNGARSTNEASPEESASAPRRVPKPRFTRADVPRLVRQADAALAAGDPERAVELLVAAQSADPVNFDLIEKLELARSTLKTAQEAHSRIEAGRVAFRQGQYDEALRIFYRVPAEHRPAQLDRWIAAGWYNLGVRSLQAGNTHEALQFFNDSLDHAPGDPLAARNREVAIRYQGRKRDEAYRIYVQSLKTRKLPE